MHYISHLFIGFFVAFFSLVPPGMLNMTAVRIKIKDNRKTALLFSFGAAVTVIPQVYMSLVFAKFFAKHPEILDQLTIAGIIVLFSLSAFFFFLARKKFQGEAKKRKGNLFIVGMFMSAMNMLAIPFYLVMSAVLEKKGLLTMAQPFINLFVLGAFLGTFTLFSVYVYFASIIENKVQFIAQNINYILSALFFVLAILSLTRFLK